MIEYSNTIYCCQYCTESAILHWKCNTLHCRLDNVILSTISEHTTDASLTLPSIIAKNVSDYEHTYNKHYNNILSHYVTSYWIRSYNRNLPHIFWRTQIRHSEFILQLSDINNVIALKCEIISLVPLLHTAIGKEVD